MVENFNFVQGFQFALSFDPTQIQFDTLIQSMGGLIGPISFNENLTVNGTVPLIWTNFNAEGQTIADGEQVFTICFDAVGDPSDCVELFFNENLSGLIPASEIEVLYQPVEGISCTDDSITIDGGPSACIEISCASLSIIDINYCNSEQGMASLNFEACGGVTPYNYTVTNNNTGIETMGTFNADFSELPTDISPIPAGTYTILVTDSGGASTSRVITIDSAPSITFDVDATNPVCPTATTGVISVTNINGGVPNYSIAFPNGLTYQDETEAEATRLINGAYQVSVTDDNGCVVTEDVILNTPEILLDIVVDSATCLGSDDGFLSVTPSGGTSADGTYIINGFQSTNLTTNTPFQDFAFNDILNAYQIRITDDNFCPKDTNIVIPVRGGVEGIIFSDFTPVACKGDSTGGLNIVATIPGNYQFRLVDELGNFRFDIIGWGASPTEANLIGFLPAETYFMRIVDNNTGCSLDTSFVITEPDEALFVTTDFAEPSCNLEDGAAEVNPTGGISPYDYDWAFDPLETSNTLQNIPADTYLVTVTDDGGCSIETSVEITSGDRLEILASILTGLNCDGTGMGELFVEIINSTANSHSYEWTDEDGNVISNLPTAPFTESGTYYIEVGAGQNSCVALDSVIVLDNSAFTFDIEIIPPSCPDASNGAINFSLFSGGVAPYECAWSHDTSLTSCLQSDLEEGEYTITLTDATGCAIDTTIDLVASDSGLMLVINTTDVACDQINGTGSIEILTGSGSTDISCAWEDVSITDCNPMDLAAGTYNVTVSDANGCSIDTFATILDLSLDFTLDANISSPSCTGDLGSISISNVGGGVDPYDITWSDNSLSGLDVIDLVAGTYTATIEDANNCLFDTSFVLINVDNSFIPEFVFQAPTCINSDDGFISLLSCIGCNCEWEDPSLDDQNCDLVGLTQGIFNVTVTDANGCQKDTMVDISVTEGLEIAVDMSSIIDADCFEAATGQASVTVTNDPLGIGDFDFFWSEPLDNNSGLDDDASNLAQGQNWVYAFDGFCQSDTFFFTIGEPNKLRLDFDNSVINSTFCKGSCEGSVMLESRGGTSASGDYTYDWSDGGTGSDRTDLCPGWNYVTISDDRNCMQLDSVFIIEPDTLIVNIDSTATTDLSCFGNNTGSITIDAQGGCFDFQYEWPNNISDSNSAQDLSQGNYVITVTDGCGCVVEVEYEIQGLNPITAVPLDPETAVCFGGSATVGFEDVSGGIGDNYTYSINFGNRIPIDSFAEVPIGMYTLTVFDSIGCSEVFSVNVNQPPQFIVDLGADISLDLGETNTVIDANVSNAQGMVSYMWFSESPFECIDPTDCSSISISPTGFSTYEIEVTDENGCTTSDVVEVDIKADRNVYIPNVFRPEADPPNDRFMVLTGQGVESLNSFRIFDRWGNLVFELENIPAPTNIDMGWDGRKGSGPNTEVEQGVYVYTAEVRFVDGQIIKYKGGITLLK